MSGKALQQTWRMLATAFLFIAAALMLTVAAGCVPMEPRREGSENMAKRVAADVAKISPADQAVLRTVLTDWVHDPESEGEVWPPRTNGVLVVLILSHAFTHAVQIEVDASPRVIPQDVMASFTRRNAQAFDISSIDPVDPRIMIVNQNDMEWFDFARVYPKAKGYAAISVPGYSSRGDQTLVRISGGPSRHGFTCTYLLEKKSDGWAIKWKKTAHYL